MLLREDERLFVCFYLMISFYGIMSKHSGYSIMKCHKMLFTLDCFTYNQVMVTYILRAEIYYLPFCCTYIMHMI